MTRSRTITAAVGTLVLCGGTAIALAQPAERPQGGPGAGQGTPAAEHRGPPRGGPAGEVRGQGPGADARGPGAGPEGRVPSRGLGSAAPAASGDVLAPAPSGSGPRGHAYGRGHGRGPVPPALIAARRERAKAYFEAARQSRAERVKAHREAIKKQWGDAAAQPQMGNELRMHAWRLARLDAIKRIATDEGNTDLVTRCDALIERENARHEKRMAALKAGPDAAGSAAPSAATPASAAPAAVTPTPAPKPAAS